MAPRTRQIPNPAGRSTRSRRGAIPDPTIHPNGAVEIAFHANSNEGNSAQPLVTPSLPTSQGGLPIVTAQDTNNTEMGTHEPQVSNQFDLDDPFLEPAMASGSSTQPADTRIPFQPPQTPSSIGSESFGSPSPSSSELNESPRTQRNVRHPHFSTVTPQTRQTPRSRYRSQHLQQRQVDEAKKLKARDVWTFFQKVDGHQECLFCQQKQRINPAFNPQRYALKTSVTVLRTHLCNEHIEQWVDGCDRFGITIGNAKSARERVDTYRQSKGQEPHGSANVPPQKKSYSRAAFTDALVEFIVADDQSLNVVECPQLRALFCMLREDLTDSDIPHRTYMRNHVGTTWKAHLESLERDMTKSLGKISMTMDLWSDPNLSPFMAVTAHWIEAQPISTPQGLQHSLRLRSDLIGFHHVPGHHTGEHLSHAFLYVLDRINIANKIGWVTLDNASNNDTFTLKLGEELRRRGISFHHVENRIRCFPHIVNLACKAVLTALTNLDYAREPTSEAEQRSFLDAVEHDPIATIRALIRVIRSSSVRRQHFAQIVQTFTGKNLQLLRDVDTRWSSALFMIERALILEDAIKSFLNVPEFQELKKYQLDEDEWNALATAREILMVPFAFQQRLSGHKTPTLCDTIPSFEAMIRMWTELQNDDDFRTGPEYEIIQSGLDKLTSYQERIELVPAYVVSMILNPSTKLGHYAEHAPEKYASAKELFRRTLLPYHARTRPSASQSDQSPQNLSPDTESSFPGTRYTPLRSRANRFGRNGIRSRTADEILGFARPTNSHDPNHSLDQEIEAYLLDKQTSSSSILFWQENQLRYPTLFLAALDYLPIQGSAVPCERIFSSAKETTTDRRNRISEDLMEELQMLKYSLKNHNLDFSIRTSEHDIIEYLEAAVEPPEAVVADVHSYLQSLAL